MATIEETLILRDQFSNPMAEYIGLVQEATDTMKDMRGSLMNIETASAQMAISLKDDGKEIRESNKKTAQSYTDMITQIGAAVAGAKSIQWLVGTSDMLTQIDSRLQMITGSEEAAAEMNEEIFSSAQRARGSYQEMAQLAARLGTLAPESFSSGDELTAFAEQVQLQMKLSMTSAQGVESVMTQLSQAMSSGVLRGEELNSIMEQAPTIIQTIGTYLGKSTGEIREMAAEGQITADVVKNALFDMADETNEKISQMPRTWDDIWNAMENTVVKAMTPILDTVSAVPDYIAENWDSIYPVILGVAGAVGVLTAATVAQTAAQWASNAAILASPVGWVALAIGGLIIVIDQLVKKYNEWSGANVSTVGVILGYLGVAYTNVKNTAAFFYNTFASIGNYMYNVFHNTTGSVEIFFYDMITNVLGYVAKMAKGIEDLLSKIGVNVDLSSGINAALGNLTAKSDALKEANGWVEYFKPMGYDDYSSNAGKFYNFGADLENTVANMFSGGVGGFDYSSFGGSETQSTLQDISKDVGSIKKEVNMADEDIKALVDMAERKYVANVNLTSQAPVINIQGANTGNTAGDRIRLAETLKQMLMEQMAAGTTRATAVPVKG